MPSSQRRGFSPFMKPMGRRANPDEETTDWRAVCGKTASTVRRAGRARALSDPYPSSAGSIFPDPELAEVAKAVFTTKQFSENKQYGLLTAWGNEAVIRPYAEDILEESTAAPETYKNAAFRIVARHEDSKALEYALRQLGKGSKTVHLEELTEFIASVDPLNE